MVKNVQSQKSQSPLMSRIMWLTQPLSFWIPQVVQGLDVLGVVHVVGILLGGEVETADADVVRQEQHRWVSCAEDHTVNAAAAGFLTRGTCTGVAGRRSHPGQRTPSRAAPRRSGNHRRRNTRSSPSCSCTPADRC